MDGSPVPKVSDEDDFTAFARAHAGMLWRAAWGLCGNAATADDLAQIGLVAAWRHWADISASDPKAYAYKSMLNAFLRDRGRRWAGEIPSGDLTVLRADSGDGSETFVETREMLRQALLRLPPRQRGVVVLRYLVDLPERAVAQAMGCSVGAVKSHASKAIIALRASPGLESAFVRGVVDEH